MRSFLLSLLLLTLVGVEAAPAQETLSLPLKPLLRDVRLQGLPALESILLHGARPARQEDGGGLPSLSYCLIIPASSRVRSVSLEGGSERFVASAEALRSSSILSTPLTSREGNVPAVEYVGDAWWHGRHLIYLRVRPLRVEQESGDLYLREGGKILVELQGAEPKEEVVGRVLPNEGVQRRDRAELLRTIANPQDLDRFTTLRPLTKASSAKTAALPASDKIPSLLTGPYRYLVITRDSLVPQFERLAELRERQGLPSTVVSVEEIEANGRRGLDLAETIRLYLQDAYEKWGVDYVLLGGDTEIIPTRYVTSTYYPSGGETQIPADFYFAGLDGSWNADGDATFGEPYVTGANPGDYCDFVPELAIGRAPVSTFEEATVFVDKVLDYESGADGERFAHALFGSEVLFPPAWQPGDPITRDGASFSETLVASIELARPGEWTLTRRYQNYTSYPGALEETYAAILSDLNSGNYGLFHHIGHGFYYNMSVGDKNILVSDADALTNGSSTFVLMALNCDSAAFDFNCLLERFLRNPNGGSVASIGSSRAAFDNTTGSYQQALYKALFAARRQRLGDAILESRLGFAVDTFYNTVDRWTQLVYTLLGDPAMRMWTAVPKPITVSAPAMVTVGSGPLAVTVDETQGGGVDSVAVVLRKPGEDLIAGWTDANGEVSLPFAPKEAGSWTLWVSGRDVMPDSMTVQVTAATQAALALSGFTLDDSQGNGNGIAEAGELVSILPALINGGQSVSSAGTLTLSTEDEGVTLLQDVAGFSPLAAESPGAANGPFSLQLAADLADASRLHFLLSIDEDGGGHFEDSFDLTVSGGNLQIISLDLDDASGNQDGILDPGEQVFLNFTLKNFGSARVDSVNGVLRSLDPLATVIDSTAHWGLLDGALSTQDNGQDLLAVQESDTANPHLYRLLLTDSAGATHSFDFDLRRPAALTGLEPGLAQAGSVLLRWDPSSAADLLGYQVERRVKGQSTWIFANADLLQAGSVFLDEGLPDRTSFEYQVRAVDRAGLAGPASEIITAVTPPPEVGCFPLPIDQETRGACAVGDVDGDGVLDLAVGSGHIYLIDGLCREKVDGDDNAQTFGPLAGVGGGFQPSGMTLGNLDQIGTDMQIVGENWTSHELYIYNADGSLQSGWPQTLGSKAWTTPVLGDLDQDGSLEIITNDIGGFTYAFHMDGNEVADGDSNPQTKGPIAPRRTGESFGRTTPALYDVDNDGKPEILFGSKFQNGAPEYFYALKGDGSGNAAGWPKIMEPLATFLASPAVGDLDGDGQMEIVAPCDNDSLYVWETDGTRFPNFPVYLHARAIDFDSQMPSPALADLDGNGTLEIVAVSIELASEARVYVFDDSGNVNPGWPQVVPGLSESSPVVADLDGDLEPDIVFGIGGGTDNLPNLLYVWHADGVPFEGFPIPLEGYVWATPTLCDFNGDGRANIVLASWDRLIHVWDMGGTWRPSLAPWPTFHQNARRDGVHPLPPLTARGAGAETETDASRPRLAPNVPNPFNPATAVSFVIPAGGARPCELTIFDLAGRRVRVLARGPLAPGLHELRWDGRDDAGRAVASGVYFAHLLVSGFEAQSQKMVLVR